MHPFKLAAFADEASPMIDNQIAAMKRNGVLGVELRQVDGENISSITLEKAREVKAKLDAQGLKAWSLGSPLGKIDIETGDYAAELEKLKHTIELAHVLGAENIRMFSFYMPKDGDPAAYRQQVLDRLGEMAAIARGTGVTLCHENEARIYGEAPIDCEDIMKQFGGRMKSVLDMGNFAFCNQDPMEGYERLRDYIEYIHIKDAFNDGTIVPAGSGKGRIAEILSLYNDFTDREVILTLEPHLTTFSGLDKLSNMDDIKVQNAFETPEIAFDAGTQALRDILANIK